MLLLSVFFIICPVFISLYNIAVHIYIYIYNVAVLIIICRFESTLVLRYATFVEIGPSSESQGQHRRKDATEQMKNLTLARTRTQIPGFSSADALATKQRVPVAEPKSLSL